jgi:hypothetical protein
MITFPTSVYRPVWRARFLVVPIGRIQRQGPGYGRYLPRGGLDTTREPGESTPGGIAANQWPVRSPYTDTIVVFMTPFRDAVALVVLLVDTPVAPTLGGRLDV